MLPSTIV
jgi:hypothetical protein